MVQDDNQVWTNFASWTDSYLNYIRSPSRKRMDTVSFRIWLAMREIGPWEIQNPDHMWELASIILAVLIKANEDIVIICGSWESSRPTGRYPKRPSKCLINYTVFPSILLKGMLSKSMKMILHIPARQIWIESYSREMSPLS